MITKKDPVTDPSETIGALADAHAKDKGIAGRQFSYKIDGVEAPRDAPSKLLESAVNDPELVEVTGSQYPENVEDE